eukprot:CAMPEP_0174577874 /NCGR_PEP_ID=MMETSP0929-20130131/290_1 /TAXON_ID=548131 ORGANISM="Ostreococcus mediterraneus, Strain clade-D-RCC2572" /NCGR_SAMPLE_ID=MMETSP0929 /ASSEMBLY_ACC=CAM_ASM_000573 /LENGTH=49 /DNA_ID= /DNA_START= /DNA_END= /DNA_ORIENTATION=
MKRCPAHVIDLVHVRPRLDQHTHYSFVAILCGETKRRPALVIRLVHVRA